MWSKFQFSILSKLLLKPTIIMSICYPLVIPTWNPLLSFTWNSFPGEARCWVFLRNLVTYRDHLLLDIFGGWHISISPYMTHIIWLIFSCFLNHIFSYLWCYQSTILWIRRWIKEARSMGSINLGCCWFGFFWSIRTKETCSRRKNNLHNQITLFQGC